MVIGVVIDQSPGGAGNGKLFGSSGTVSMMGDVIAAITCDGLTIEVTVAWPPSPGVLG